MATHIHVKKKSASKSTCILYKSPFDFLCPNIYSPPELIKTNNKTDDVEVLWYLDFIECTVDWVIIATHCLTIPASLKWKINYKDIHILCRSLDSRRLYQNFSHSLFGRLIRTLSVSAVKLYVTKMKLTPNYLRSTEYVLMLLLRQV